MADRHADASPTPDGLRREAVDLTAADEVEALWERLAADDERPRWVVNAVGGFRGGTVADSEPDAVRFAADLNLGTAWWSCRSASRPSAGRRRDRQRLVALREDRRHRARPPTPSPRPASSA